MRVPLIVLPFVAIVAWSGGPSVLEKNRVVRTHAQGDSCLIVTGGQLSDLLAVAKSFMEPTGAQLRHDKQIPLVPTASIVPVAPSASSCQQAATTYRTLRGSFMSDSAYPVAVVKLGSVGYLGRFLWVVDERTQQFVFLDSTFTARSTIDLHR